MKIVNVKNSLLGIVGILSFMLLSYPVYAETDVTTGLAPSENTPTIIEPITQQSSGGNVLWDTYHGVSWDYSPSGRFSSLESLLVSKGYTVDENNSGILNLDLGDYDIIVICNGSASNSVYSAAEVAAIENFVNSGGGLLIMGDNTDTPNGNINPISQTFGTTLGISYISPLDVYITNMTAHAIFTGVSEIYMGAAGEIAGTFPSSEEAWDLSDKAVVTVAEPMSGRVVSLGDINSMDNTYITISDNQLFSENVFDWLVNGNDLPPVLRVDPTEMPPVTLAPDETTTQTLTLHNDGEGILRATLSIDAHNSGGNPQLIPGEPQSDSSITADRNAGSENTKEVGELNPVFTPLAENLEVLYVNTMGDYDPSFRSGLQGLPNIGTLDILDGTTSTPNVDYLLQYDVVVLASKSGFADSTTLGNNLADYVDAGGRVILLVATFGTGGGYTLDGRIITPTYLPLAMGEGGSDSTAVSIVNHPITQGVNSLSAALPVMSFTTQGNGQSLGTYDTGYLIGAYNPDKPIVAINVFPEDGYWNGDLIRLVGNALDWVAGSGWLSLAPTTVEVPPHGNVSVEVTYNATDMTEGDYAASILIASNDPANPEVTVPATLRVQVGPPPVMEVSPSTIEDTLREGESSAHTLTLSNTGESRLTYNLSLVTQTSTAPTEHPILTEIPDGVGYRSDELLIGIAEGAVRAEVALLRESLNATLKKTIKQLNIEVWNIPATDEPGLVDLIQELSANLSIEYAEPNYIQKAIGIPNDTRFDDLWGMHNTGQTGGTADADIDAVEAWDTFTGSRDVVVAVIDTGVDYNHVDLVDNRWVNEGEIPSNGVDDDGNGYIDDVYGYDFAYDDSDPMDGDSHGTHCSGTIGGVGNNSIGVAGVSHAVRIMAVKFLNDSGSGSTDDAIDSIIYAVDNGAQILSNSWGGGGFSQGLKDAISYANDHNVLFVAAAGNDSLNNDVYPNYPSNYEVPNVLAVAATDDNDALAWFSNYGLTTVDLGAPGDGTLSTVPGNGYGYKSGTSMATPHVSGAAALLKGYNPSLTALELKSIIMDSVDPVASMSGITVTGGRLNINNALMMAGTPWITLEGELTGEIAPGDSVEVTVLLNATELTLGDYTAEINVDSNDPVNPHQVVDVVLHVSDSSGSQLQFSSATYSIIEDGGQVTLTVTRTGSSNGAVSVDYATSDDTATASDDYTQTSDTLNWADGDDADKPIPVDIIDDSLLESDETFIVSLANPTGGAELGTPDTALVTITDNDSIFDCKQVTEISKKECDALVAFYESTDGENWVDNTGWKVTNTPCSWNGVSCQSQHVTGLSLGNNNIKGTISPKFFKLKTLESLVLSDNDLNGTSFNNLNKLNNLETLWLNNCKLSGKFPNSLMKLKKLEELDLHDNCLKTKVPKKLKKWLDERNPGWDETQTACLY
jgi:subtilisin family serine protease